MELNKLIYSGILVILGLAFYRILKYHLYKSMDRYGMHATQQKLIERVYVLITISMVIIGLISIWGVEIKNLWLFLTSVIGLVAIGFVAIWSILANILSGWVLLTSKHFRINSTIEIVEDKVSGKLKDITLMFSVIEDAKGNQIIIPNNTMMQKLIKVKKK